MWPTFIIYFSFPISNFKKNKSLVMTLQSLKSCVKFKLAISHKIAIVPFLLHMAKTVWTFYILYFGFLFTKLIHCMCFLFLCFFTTLWCHFFIYFQLVFFMYIEMFPWSSPLFPFFLFSPPCFLCSFPWFLASPPCLLPSPHCLLPSPQPFLPCPPLLCLYLQPLYPPLLCPCIVQKKFYDCPLYSSVVNYTLSCSQYITILKLHKITSMLLSPC